MVVVAVEDLRMEMVAVRVRRQMANVMKVVAEAMAS